MIYICDFQKSFCGTQFLSQHLSSSASPSRCSLRCTFSSLDSAKKWKKTQTSLHSLPGSPITYVVNIRSLSIYLLFILFFLLLSLHRIADVPYSTYTFVLVRSPRSSSQLRHWWSRKLISSPSWLQRKLLFQRLRRTFVTDLSRLTPRRFSCAHSLSRRCRWVLFMTVFFHWFN